MPHAAVRAVLALTVVSSLGWAQARQNREATVLLRYALQPGTQWTYELSYRYEEVRHSAVMGSEGKPVTMICHIPLHYTLLSATRDTLVLREVVDSLVTSVVVEGARSTDTIASPRGVEITHTLTLHGGPVSATSNVRDSLLWRWLGFEEGGRSIMINRRRWPSWFFSYPAQAIPVGHTWSEVWRDSIQREDEQTVWSANVRHTLEAVVDTLGHRCARIRSEIDSLKLSSKARTDFGDDFSMELSGRGVALTYVQLSNGLPLAQQESLDVEGGFVVSGQAEVFETFEERTRIQLRRR
ncbi:MAG: hypothetical protein ABDH31_07465 [Chlorobiota bacterium]